MSKKGVEWETERLSVAIQFIDEVHRSVPRNGSDWVINTDEISCKVISPPRALLAHVGGEHPPILLSNKSHKEAFTMILATTPSGMKLKPAVVLPDRGPCAKKAFAHLLDRCHVLWGYRWYGEDMWQRYITEVIELYCRGHPATLVIDSSPVHLTDLCADTAIEQDIYTVVVPPTMTRQLQPNDVHAYGPLSSEVRRDWLRQLREEAEVYDSVPRALERYLRCWGGISRQAVEKAWMKAIPLLRGHRGHTV